MDIQRGSQNVSLQEMSRRVRFCLEQLERGQFNQGIGWKTELVPHLTLEELVGALVAVESALGRCRVTELEDGEEA